ncbi:molybdate ABC transporter substrate-binding protein [Anaeromyxobacter terrae]|uniref:molybdate ABC transporter substrate-binding protein n=1 Tax=Anaeromyxobacter terrae TaxID=2925406 RepID=UPI001F582E37|nr:molybdate ABC transporter substrate-binding protein [Anaeromyxobacter sp. SG22]
MRYLLLLLAVLGGPARAVAAERQLSVAAAANLKPALDELVRAFEARRPEVKVRVTYGASGAFFAQIQSGAPLDLFFSADRDYPQRLVAAGLAADEVVYAIGRLALWVPAGSSLDVERRGLAALADPAVRKVAIANPALAPYGRAAEGALRAAGVLDAVRPKLVLGTSVAQAAQFAVTGAADAALVPRSLASSPELAVAGRSVPLPDGLAPPIEQSAVVLSGARSPGLARDLLAFARGADGRRILARHGYALP